MPAEKVENRDIIVQPDSFLFMQNEGKNGSITVHRGPTVVNQTGQDFPLKYNPASHSYENCTLEKAVQVCPRANEGDYVVLENPAENGSFPNQASQPATTLSKGRKVVIPGPWCEALWPGQNASVIEGHRLRTNQYLVAIVYNSEEANKNWEKGTIVKQQTETSPAGNHDDKTNPQANTQTAGQTGDQTNAQANTQTNSPQKLNNGLAKPENLSVGTRIIIKGSDISFYIPCTGCEVLRDESTGKYVREAVTLEQLEYCCLVDESGKKEYPHGPAVVFPRPTQVFEEDNKKRRKFRPIELNNINGIHLKVTADFEGPNIESDLSETRKFKEGEELFVTGKTLSIYYPREELAIVEYGQGNKKHYSTAIPEGEARYVINRQTGEIKTIVGPKMFLADPRTEIPVRRVLSIDDCKLWYPGNQQAIDYNTELAAAMSESPSGRSGMISEGDYRKRLNKRSLSPSNASNDAYLSASGSLEMMTEIGSDEGSGAETTIRRGTNFTPPRSITLNTKYDGVPRVEVWPSYAVLVIGSKGERKVVEGPQAILLEYGQKLGFMDLSTGTPKKADKTLRTAYLCVRNNQVGDIISFESKDHVKGKVRISLRVNFEATSEEEKLRWFSVDNYVKFLTDHVRSLIGGMTKKNDIAEIKGNYVDLIRDTILGLKASEQKRSGLAFDNGMRVVEVEVLELTLDDAKIANLLNEYQSKVVENDIKMASARKDLEVLQGQEQINQEKERVVQETVELRKKLQLAALTSEIELSLAKIGNELLLLDKELVKSEKKEKALDLTHKSLLARTKETDAQTLLNDTAKAELEKTKLEFATEAAVKRFTAAKDGLYEVLVSLGRDEMAAKLAEACTIERWLSGDNISSSISNLLSVAPTLQAFFNKAQEIQTADPSNRLRNKQPVAVK